MKFFQKTNPGNRIIDRGGKAIDFLRIGDGRIGIIEVDESKLTTLAEDIAGYAKKGAGGVSEISAEIYAELKKNPQYNRYAQSLSPKLKLFDVSALAPLGQKPIAPTRSSAQSVEVLVSAPPVAGSSHAPPAKAQASSPSERRSPRLGSLERPASADNPGNQS